MPVELSGGIPTTLRCERALATGCARVNLGTAALETPSGWRGRSPQHGERVAVGLDVRSSTATTGSPRAAGRSDGGDLWEASPGWTATAAPATSSPT